MWYVLLAAAVFFIAVFIGARFSRHERSSFDSKTQQELNRAEDEIRRNPPMV